MTIPALHTNSNSPHDDRKRARSNRDSESDYEPSEDERGRPRERTPKRKKGKKRVTFQDKMKTQQEREEEEKEWNNLISGTDREAVADFNAHIPWHKRLDDMWHEGLPDRPVTHAPELLDLPVRFPKHYIVLPAGAGHVDESHAHYNITTRRYLTAILGDPWKPGQKNFSRPRFVVEIGPGDFYGRGPFMEKGPCRPYVVVLRWDGANRCLNAEELQEIRALTAEREGIQDTPVHSMW